MLAKSELADSGTSPKSWPQMCVWDLYTDRTSNCNTLIRDVLRWLRCHPVQPCPTSNIIFKRSAWTIPSWLDWDYLWWIFPPHRGLVYSVWCVYRRTFLLCFCFDSLVNGTLNSALWWCVGCTAARQLCVVFGEEEPIPIYQAETPTFSQNLLARYVRDDSCCQGLPITFPVSFHQEKRGTCA